ncbi:hypothetical protein [Psychroflexus montanilacus]|uniref:hypothetical protein n=1 Tax=Psychroflexus montanilacus TaxID=2873598 RepID=UPI001CCC4D50|nr:hypothetical protein [Psychroflexus montanilacus]MBZ9652524.1 hypothetical protein [Psychroflexus montanilacus]
MKLHTTTHYIIIGIILVIVLISTEASAQGLPPFDDDVGDEPVAPINGLIALGLAVGGYLGIRKVKK